jgi:hypothetical protein
MDAEFHGDTYEAHHDKKRLLSLLNRVFVFMAGGEWKTLSEIADACGGAEASISARLRDFRKQGYIVDRRRRGDPKNGLHEYRLRAATKINVHFEGNQGAFL